MRWIGCLLGLCLLFAGVGPKHAHHDRARTNDELAAVNAIAKLAVRRHEGTRPVGTVGLDPIALLAAETLREPPRACIEIVHASPARRWTVAHTSFDARGPPHG